MPVLRERLELRMKMRVLFGILFSIGYFALALFFSVEPHQPRLMPHVMLGYAGAASVLLWVVGRVLSRTGSFFKTVIFSTLGFGLGGGLLIVYGIAFHVLAKIEVAHSERVAATTVVENMRDEPLLSAQGTLKGIRVRYTIRFPAGGERWHEAHLIAVQDDYQLGVYAGLSAVQRLIEPPMQQRWIGEPRYARNQTYQVTLEMQPIFITERFKHGPCFDTGPGGLERLAQGHQEDRTRYRIEVIGTRFDALSQHEYSVKAFYDTAVNEGIISCAEQLRTLGLIPPPGSGASQHTGRDPAGEERDSTLSNTVRP